MGGSTYALDDALTSLDHCNYDRCIFVTSVSKMLGAGGWRAGLAAFGDDLEDFYGYAAKVASCMYTCPTAGMTYLMEEVFAPHSVLQHVLEKHLLFQRSIFTRIHSRVCAVFEGSGIEVSEAHGAWYVLLDFSKFKAALHAVGVRTSAALTARLVEEKRVVLVPGSEFGFDREALCARFSYVDLTMDESQSVDFSRIVQLCEKLVEFVDATVEAVEVRSTQAAADADCYFD